HGGQVFRQAERDTLAPGLACDSLEGDCAQLLTRFEPNPAARRRDRDRLLSLGDLGRLFMVAHELGGSTEGAKAPPHVQIGDLVNDQIKRTSHYQPNGENRGWSSVS